MLIKFSDWKNVTISEEGKARVRRLQRVGIVARGDVVGEPISIGDFRLFVQHEI
jgi:hypothetical protein